MNDHALSLLLERITNLGNHIFSVENNLIDYMEKNPKVDDQWLEQRLRALEDQLKTLKERDTQTRMMLVDLLKDFVELRDKQKPEKYNDLDKAMDIDLVQKLEEKLNADDL